MDIFSGFVVGVVVAAFAFLVYRKVTASKKAPSTGSGGSGGGSRRDGPPHQVEK